MRDAEPTDRSGASAADAVSMSSEPPRNSYGAGGAGSCSRRAALRIGASAALGIGMARPSRGAERSNAITIGFSTYGMKTMGVADSLRTLGRIGYEGVELALMPGWPAEPKLLSSADRRGLHKQREDLGLRLDGLMLNVAPTESGAAARAVLDQFAAAAKLGRDLAGDVPVPIETVLGGRPNQWDDRKDAMARGLETWARWAEKDDSLIAIKAHVSGAMNTPERAEWLRRRVDSPVIKFNYDYSHFGLRAIPFEESMRLMIPNTVFIHAKDYIGVAEKFCHRRPVLPTRLRPGKKQYVGRLAGSRAF